MVPHSSSSNKINTWRSLFGSDDKSYVLLLFVLVLIAYAATVLVPYPYWDDYGAYLYYKEGWASIAESAHTRDGRLLGAVFTFLCFRFAPSMDALLWFRVIAVVFSGLLSIQLYYSCRYRGFQPTRSLLVASIVSLSPAMAGFVGWTICYFYPPTICACIGIAEYAERLALRGRNIQAFVILVIGALAVLLTYQPLAGFLLLPLFLSYISGKNMRLRVPFVFFGALCVVYALYAVCLFPLFHKINPQWASSNRSVASFTLQHVQNLLFYWFPVFASGWFRLIVNNSVAVWLSIPSIISFFYGCYICIFRRGKKPAPGLVIFILFLALSAPHVLVLSDIWAFRTVYPLYCMFFIVAATGALDLMERVISRTQGTVLLVTALFGLTTLIVTVGIVIPARREYQLIRNSLQDAYKQSGVMLAVLDSSNDTSNHLTFVQRFAAFGNLASDTMRDISVRAVALDLWPDKSNAPVILYTDPVNARLVPGIAIADICGTVSGHPSTIQKLGTASGCVDIPLLGSMPSDGSWLYHSELGWIHPMVYGGWYFCPTLGQMAFWEDQGQTKAWINKEYLDVISISPLTLRRYKGEVGTPSFQDSRVILTWHRPDE